MRGLQLRLKRLEDRLRKKRTGAPSRLEFDDATFRQRTRHAYSSRLKLWQLKGWDEEELLQSFSSKDREFLRNDSEERRARDEDVMRRYEQANGAGEETMGGVVARVLGKLRSMVRVGNPG